MLVKVQTKESISVTPWTDITASGITGEVEYKQIGEMVCVRFNISNGLTPNNYVTVGTLPECATPPKNMYFVSQSGNGFCACNVIANGNIRVASASGATGATCTFTFMV